VTDTGCSCGERKEKGGRLEIITEGGSIRERKNCRADRIFSFLLEEGGEVFYLQKGGL